MTNGINDINGYKNNEELSSLTFDELSIDQKRALRLLEMFRKSIISKQRFATEFIEELLKINKTSGK